MDAVKFCLLLIPLIGFVAGKDIKFENCGGNITKVSVASCEEEPCRAIRGKTISLSAEFISNQNSEKLSLWVGAKLGPVDVPLPGLNRDGCKDKSITCPVKIGDKQTFTFNLPVQPMYPLVQVTALFEMTGDNEEKIILFQSSC